MGKLGILRKAKEEDIEELIVLAKELFGGGLEEHRSEFKGFIADQEVLIAVYIIENTIVGFGQGQLRFDYVEGTSTSPVLYLEGIYVLEKYRRMGIGRLLVTYIENWGKTLGLSEMGSDCQINNISSLNFHLKLGFQEIERLIVFKKEL